MANGDNNNHQWLPRWIVGGGSMIAVVLTFSITTAKDAAIALDFANQHGEELLILSQEIHRIQGDLYERTKDRYTAKDAERDIGYLRRDIDSCMTWRKEHQRNHEKDWDGPL